MSAGVYLGITADGQYGYVGMSNNVRRRIGQHKMSPFSAVIDRWVILGTFPSTIQARAYEYRAINRFRPLFNRVNNPRRFPTNTAGIYQPVSDAVRSALIETFGSLRAGAIEAAIPYATLDRRLKSGGDFSMYELDRIANVTHRTRDDLLSGLLAGSGVA